MGDFDNVEISFEDPSSTIPEGIYTVEVSSCEKKDSKAGNPYLALEAKVVGEKFAGWILRDNFNLWYENSDAAKQEMVREIAGRQFGSLLKAVDMDKAPDNASALQGLKVEAIVGIEASNNPDYPGDNNRIEGYQPISSDTSFPPKDDVPDLGVSNSEAKPKKPSL